MQRPPYVVHQPSDGDGRAGPSASVPPSTPRGKDGRALNQLMRTIEGTYHLGLTISSEPRSRAHHNSAVDNVENKIQFLFYKNESALSDVLKAFAAKATITPKAQQLDVLLNLLKREVQHMTPISRVGTPLSSRRVAQEGLETPFLVNGISRSVGLFSKHGQDTHASARAASLDPECSTDEEGVNTVTSACPREPSRSPSPSLTTKSAKRKVEPVQRPQISALVNPLPSLTKKPSLNWSRALGALPASQSTLNTSFDSGLSSQETRADTANMSFTTDVDHAESLHNICRKTSSTSFSSLDNEDFRHLDARLAGETAGKEPRLDNLPSENYGSTSCLSSSVPEHGYGEVSSRAEASNNLLSPEFPVPVHQSLPSPPVVKCKDSSEKHVLQPENRSCSTSSEDCEQPSRDPAPADPPQKLSHYIREIPKQGLFVDDITEQFQSVPYHVLFICQRVALESSISLRELLLDFDVSSALIEPKAFWSSLQAHPKIAHIKFKEPERLLAAPTPQLEGYTFKGLINFSQKQAGPVFALQLQSIQVEKSCRFQRHYGTHRFLYLKTPKIDSSNTKLFNKADLRQIRKSWADWLLSEHCFLGRTWEVFYIEPIKEAKNRTKRSDAKHDMRLVLFATSGHGIEKPCSLGEMVNWFFPFARNKTESFCKAFARLKLGLSRAVPSLVFKPSQVHRVSDIMANGENECLEHNDPSLHWNDVSDVKVMNDGCSTMSVGAAHEIWKHFKESTGIDGPLPCAFQGRIAGAKGMWMVCAESHSKDPDDLAIWIKISKKQMKFEQHEVDLSDETFDPHRLTFEVTQFSSSPAHSNLHTSFIPILADRGVSPNVMADVMIERLTSERSDLLERLSDPLRMYDYVYRNGTSSGHGVDVQWQASLPTALDKKIKFLLESGFAPTESQYLATSIERFIKTQQISQESTLRAPLGNATSLYGLADPLGVLKPGEIHVQFSSSFVDKMTNEGFLNLKGLDVLVSRQPACRRSDIQKVSATMHPQLSHLVDVVVFPSRGQFPLAGKLQGGDYDGDRFWLCWEDKLVRPFKNAPAPDSDPDPSDYGIKQDKRKIYDVVDLQNLGNLREFRRESFLFTNSESVLGIATSYREKQSYLENRMYSPILSQLDDIHDLLVDAPKQGYLYTKADFERTVQARFKLTPMLPVAAHREAMKDCESTKTMEGLDKVREKRYQYNRNNILDFLYFDILRAHNLDTMKSLKDALSMAGVGDLHLLYPRQRLDVCDDELVQEELRRVQEEVVKIYSSWGSGFRKGRTIEDYGRAVEDCYRRFQAIQPQQIDHPPIRSWIECSLVPGQCLWDTIRASTLYYKLNTPKASTFVFTMAGRELGELKAKNSPQCRIMTAQIRANMKPRPTKLFAPADDDDDDDDDDDEQANLTAVDDDAT